MRVETCHGGCYVGPFSDSRVTATCYSSVSSLPFLTKCSRLWKHLVIHLQLGRLCCGSRKRSRIYWVVCALPLKLGRDSEAGTRFDEPSYAYPLRGMVASFHCELGGSPYES